jgi:hypothetical protein
VPLVGGLRWWWRTVPANREAAFAFASLFLYVLSGFNLSQLKVRLHNRAKSMLDEFALRVFDKLAPSKAAISAFLLVEFARRANLSL